jgi:hypothetical protein
MALSTGRRAKLRVPNELLSRFRSYDYLLAFVARPVGGIAGPVVRAVAAPPVGQ